MSTLKYIEENLEKLEKQKEFLEKKKEKALLLKDIIPNIKEKDRNLEYDIYTLVHSIQKQIDDILYQIESIKNGINIVESSKEEQLVKQKKLPIGVLKKPKHINEDKLQVSTHTTSNKFNQAQGLLTDPVDYNNLGYKASQSKIDDLTEFTIINPERIPDNLIKRLEFINSNDFKSLNSEEKLKIKKGLIERLKNIFKKSITLTVNGDNKKTGRIQMINSIDEPSCGKIICFQTLRTLNLENQSFYEKIILVFDDIYNCYRAQLHTGNKLKDIEKQMQETGFMLMNLIQTWKDEGFNLKEKKDEINKILKKLKKFERYYVQKAVQNRLKKIEYKHRGNDQARLEGTKNDIKNAYLTILSQRMNIDKQAKLLDFIIKQEEESWKKVYDRFGKIIDQFNQEDLILCFDNVVFGDNLILNDLDIKTFFSNGKNKKLLEGLNHVLSSYKIKEMESFCPNPFLQFHHGITQLSTNLKSSINSNNFKEVLRLIFYTNILFKLQKYKLFLCKLENDLKIKKIDKNNILYYLNELKDIQKTISERCFLSAIKYEENSKVHQKFVYNNEIINKIGSFLKDEKYKELLKLLKKEKNKNII